jgi:Lar family restriction alleviation protein
MANITKGPAMTGETKLAPCPFCGGKKVNICATDFDGAKAYAATCRTRGCHGAIFQLGYGLFASQEEAAAAWNTRTPDLQSKLFQATEVLGIVDEWLAPCAAHKNMEGALTIARQAQTCDEIAAAIRALPLPKAKAAGEEG